MHVRAEKAVERFPPAWVSATLLNRSGQQLFPVEDASDRESYHVLTSTLQRTGECADHCAYMVDSFHPGNFSALAFQRSEWEVSCEHMRIETDLSVHHEITLATYRRQMYLSRASLSTLETSHHCITAFSSTSDLRQVIDSQTISLPSLIMQQGRPQLHDSQANWLWC